MPKQDYFERRAAAGLYAVDHSATDTAAVFHLSVPSVKYWKSRVMRPPNQVNSWGGVR